MVENRKEEKEVQAYCHTLKKKKKSHSDGVVGYKSRELVEDVTDKGRPTSVVKVSQNERRNPRSGRRKTTRYHYLTACR